MPLITRVSLKYVGEDGCEFAHDVIREVVEADLSAARQKVLHRRLAEILARIGSDHLLSCWHITT